MNTRTATILTFLSVLLILVLTAFALWLMWPKVVGVAVGNATNHWEDHPPPDMVSDVEDFDIPSMPVLKAAALVYRKTGVDIELFDHARNGGMSVPVRGTMTVYQAVRRMLWGTDAILVPAERLFDTKLVAVGRVLTVPQEIERGCGKPATTATVQPRMDDVMQFELPSVRSWDAIDCWSIVTGLDVYVSPPGGRTTYEVMNNELHGQSPAITGRMTAREGMAGLLRSYLDDPHNIVRMQDDETGRGVLLDFGATVAADAPSGDALQ